MPPNESRRRDLPPFLRPSRLAPSHTRVLCPARPHGPPRPHLRHRCPLKRFPTRVCPDSSQGLDMLAGGGTLPFIHSPPFLRLSRLPSFASPVSLPVTHASFAPRGPTVPLDLTCVIGVPSSASRRAFARTRQGLDVLVPPAPSFDLPSLSFDPSHPDSPTVAVLVPQLLSVPLPSGRPRKSLGPLPPLQLPVLPRCVPFFRPSLRTFIILIN